MGHHGMGGSQGMAIPGEDLYIGIAINRLTAETRSFFFLFITLEPRVE